MRSNPYQPPEADLDDEPRAPEVSAELANLREILEPLKQTRPWVKLVAVTGFVASGFLVLFGVVALVVDLRTVKPILAAVYLLAGIVYVPPSLHLWRYARSIQELLRDRETSTLARALDHQRKFWHFSGVLTLLVVAVYSIALLVGLVMFLAKPRL